MEDAKEDISIGLLRDQIWSRMLKARQLGYPIPAFGHHPNFKGASKAAQNLIAYLFAKGQIKVGDNIISYPDYVLKPLRKRLLENGVNVVVPAKYKKAYRYLASHKVEPAKASSIAGAEKEGELITDLPSLSLAAIACVALSPKGDVVGKGYGFSLPSDLDLPCVSIAHPMQVVEGLRSIKRLSVYATPDAAWVC